MKDINRVFIDAAVKNISDTASSLCIISTETNGLVSVDLIGRLAHDKQLLIDGLIQALNQLKEASSSN